MENDIENVQVVVRIRPMQANEKKNGDIPCVRSISNGKEVQVKVGPLEAQNYRCNKCFSPETSQDSFFEECGISDLIDSTVEGYKACVFAFGQTGAGKTYTMIGGSKGLTHYDKHVGLIARSLSYLFKKLDHLEMKYRIKLSCVEIYQEHIYDLFTEEKERVALNVREHQIEGFFLEGLKYIECRDFSLACSVLDLAVKNRQIGGHDLNKRSSRSHCITEIHLELKNPERGNDLVENAPSQNDFEYSIPEINSHSRKQSGQLIRGKISLVDLAGSERLKHTNSTGKVLQEAGFINRSLYVLGKVIAGLVRTEGDLNHKDVPFRDSKLTKLLISSLGGNSRTLLIACVSEAKGSQAETLRTLKFSMSCARIRNKPVKFLDPQEKLILDLKQEIKRLKNENKKLRTNLLTAPASNGRPHQSGISDDEVSSTVSPTKHRAVSAHEHRPLDYHQSFERKRTQQKKTSIARKVKDGRRLKSTQSELLAKYPQLNKILRLEKRGNNSHDNLEHTRLRPKYKSIVEDVHEITRLNEEPSVRSDENRRKISQDLLDEMVHRRASGPLIFKDKSSPLLSVRSSWQYQPADNYTKQLDQQATELLSSHKGGSDEDNRLRQHMLRKEAAEVRSKGKTNYKGQPHSQKTPKPSPYIAHLMKKKMKKKNAQGLKDNEKNFEMMPSSDRDSLLPTIVTQVDLKPSSELHDSIEKAFAEFGVGSNPAKKLAVSTNQLPKIDSSSKKAGRIRQEAKKERESLPVLLHQKKDVDELDLSGGALEVLRSNFDQKRNIVSAPVPPRETVELLSTPDRLRKKLLVLEESLIQQRTDMEDNPGHVTDEMEEKYKSLQKEVNLLKVEITGLTGEVFVESPSPVKSKLQNPADRGSKKTGDGEEEDYADDDYESFYEEDFAAGEEDSLQEKLNAVDLSQIIRASSSEKKEEEENEPVVVQSLLFPVKSSAEAETTPEAQEPSPVNMKPNQNNNQATNDEDYENDAYGDEEFDDFED